MHSIETFIEGKAYAGIAKSLPGPVFVFGAGGFIGFNLFCFLASVRDDVYAITHDINASWRLQFAKIPSERIVYCDLNSAVTIDYCLKTFHPKTVFNLAAYGAYSRQKNTHLIFATNFTATVTLLEALQKTGFERYVHAGSSSEYGINAAGPDESAEMIPNSHYAVSKTGNSYFIKYMGTVRKLPVVNLRLFSVYGPWEEPDRLMPVLIEKARAKEFPPFVSPSTARDFVYIDDAVGAFVMAAGKISPEIYGQSFNIGNDAMTTMADLAQRAKSLFSIPGDPQFDTMEKKQWDLDLWYSNSGKARATFGWTPLVSLDEGLRKTFAWQSSVEYAALKRYFETRGLKHTVEVSAVIACYKDEQAIPEMYERLTAVFRKMGIGYEMIFVNDHSPDGTRRVLRELSLRDGNVVAVEHSRNFGSQSAFISGMEASTGRAVVLMDGDLQDPPELIEEFCAKWKEGFDVVYGKREKREAPFWLNVSYKAFYRLFHKMSYVNIPLDAGDFSLMDRKVVDELLSLPEKDQFLRGLRAWVGFNQTGVPYLRPKRKYGVSTNSLLKNIQWAKKGIFSFSYVPLEIMGYSGIAMMAVCFCAMVLQIVAKLIFPNVPHGITTIIVLMLFIGGLQLFALSMLGEYVGKIFEEAKSRPKFIRNSIFHGGREYSNRADILAFLLQRKNVQNL